MLCLPKEEREKMSAALRSGKLSLEELYRMTSAERRAAFEKYTGEQLAQAVNAKFEQAMLSNQKKALRNWIEKVTQRQDPIRRDMLKRVERVEKYLSPDEEYGFLTDLAEAKLGVRVTEEEAAEVLRLSKQVQETRDKVPEAYTKLQTTPPIKDRPREALAYGYAQVAFKNYTQELRERAESLSWDERKKLSNLGENLWDLAGVTKSLKGSLDNSFMGRQGIGVLLRGNVKLWAKNFANSFKTFGAELSKTSKDTTVLDAIKADILSRPNAINGTYNLAKNKFGLDLLTEESYPSLDPQKLPLLGKAFKASSTAFNGTALQLRADLADAFIAHARKNGIDVEDAREVTGLGLRVATLTGRGELTTTAPIGDKLNLALFAPRFLRSRFNIITGGQAYSSKLMSPYARREAAKDTLRIAMGIGSVLATAKMLGFEAETDPRSSKFGQVCFGGKCVDTTGGIRGLATIASRLTPTFHNGEWGFWTKSGSSGKWTRMSQGGYGEITALDMLEQFFEGKLSPPLGVLRDILKGQTYGGEKPGVGSTITSLTVPIGIETAWDNFKKGDDTAVMSAISDALGFSTSPQTLFPSGNKWKALQEQEGPRVHQDVLEQVTDRYNLRKEQLMNSNRWFNMTNEEQNEALNKIKKEETDRALRRYGI